VSLPVLAWATEDDDEECPNDVGWKPSESELASILKRHKDWISQMGSSNPAIAGRANLCNADLNGANLSGSSLQGARLAEANLRNATLSRSDLREADLIAANLIGADPKGANLSGANLSGALMFSPIFFPNRLFDPFGSFTLRIRRVTDLSEVDLSNANLNAANLFAANLTSANLRNANLEGARLNSAKLVAADLSIANLKAAGLSGADLQASTLDGTDIAGATFTGANLTNAFYEPISSPSSVHLSGMTGIKTLHFGLGGQTGLILLRKALQEAGLRQLEREATYAIEHGVNAYALAGHGDDADYEGTELIRRDIGAMVEGAFKVVFFEWTTDWGLRPGRALLILVAGIGFFSVFYFVALSPRHLTAGAGIYREWPQGRIVESANAQGTGWDCSVAQEAESERLQPGLWCMIGFALYFSLLSAFSIGWRDLNVGSWLTKLQPLEFGLRARGWARFVSGLQSLVSVYLVAIAILTYFGGPFQ
jgi:uncharacterized protein YjbI with pentapeptide repeats